MLLCTDSGKCKCGIPVFYLLVGHLMDSAKHNANLYQSFYSLHTFTISKSTFRSNVNDKTKPHEHKCVQNQLRVVFNSLKGYMCFKVQ